MKIEYAKFEKKIPINFSHWVQMSFENIHPYLFDVERIKLFAGNYVTR